jgi:hypothetical protein
MASFSGLYDMMTSQYSYTSPLSYISYITPVFHWIWWIISWGIFSSKQKKNRVRPNQVECVYIHIGRSSNWEDPSTWDEEKDISILFGYSINLTICYLSRQKQPLFCLTCGFCFFNGFTSFINENFFDGVRDRSSCSLFKIFLFRHFISSIYNILI